MLVKSSVLVLVVFLRLEITYSEQLGDLLQIVVVRGIQLESYLVDNHWDGVPPVAHLAFK